jgi:hypothetical protein
MKRFINKSSLMPLCSLALAFGAFIRFSGTSFCFFGEPEMPSK